MKIQTKWIKEQKKQTKGGAEKVRDKKKDMLWADVAKCF